MSRLWRESAVPWLELAPGSIIVGQGGQLHMITGIGWERPEDTFDRGRFRVHAIDGIEGIGATGVTRWLTPAQLEHPATVLLPVDDGTETAVTVAGQALGATLLVAERDDAPPMYEQHG